MSSAVAAALAGWLPDRLNASQVPGAAAAVVGKDKIVWEQTFGVLDGPGSPRVTPDTIFCIRSISKSVTALAVLMAVQDGLVDLDAPISKYLPGFTVRSRFERNPERLITLRHLLSHWAGLAHDPPQDIDPTRPDSFRRYIERISESWLRFPVGYRHEYSNFGVDLAAYLIQTCSGTPFAAYARKKVLGPIGMTRSTFDLEAAGRAENRALGHDGQGGVASLPFLEIAAAGLYSTIRDMARYAQFHLNDGVVDGRRLLREDLMRQFHSIQFAGRGQRTGYGLGLIREAVSNTFCLYHEGGGQGFGSHLMLYPELGFGTVILTNREYHGITGVQGRNIMNGPLINRYGPISIAGPETDRMRRIYPDDARLEQILGRYGDSPGSVVGCEDGVIGIRMNKDQFVPMTFYDDEGQLVGMYDAAREARFLPAYGNRRGAMMIVSRVSSNNNFHYLDYNDSPLDPPGPGKPEWRSYEGEYDEFWGGIASSAAEVAAKNGYLYYRDGKCEEIEPGLFFRYNGEILDFRSTPPTISNSELRRKKPRG